MLRILKIGCLAGMLLAVLHVSAEAQNRRGGGGGRGGGVHMGGGGGHFGGGHMGGGARFGGGHFGGAHFGGARMAGPRATPHFGGGGRHFGGMHTAPRSFARPRATGRSFAGRASPRSVNRAANLNRMNRNAVMAGQPNARSAARSLARTNAVQQRLNSTAVAGVMRNQTRLRDPSARTQLVANAATAGWRGRHGWWRHGHGGYGWVGPVFWPFAYNDLYDYTFWGYGYDPTFWDYGYGDIYAGLFAPYDYDALAGYLPQRVASGSSSGRGGGNVADNAATASGPVASMCGDDSRTIAGFPIDQIQQAIQPTDEQRALLDDLANAAMKAAQDIRAACPTTAALTAPARLAAMETRISAMIGGIQTVQPALDKFYDSLNDEQKARLTALGEQQRKKANAEAGDQNCGIASMSEAMAWPTDEINQRLQPNEAQKAKLASLQDATFKAADQLKNTCRPSTALTPPARLVAAGQRLDAMLQAVKSVHASLDEFYGSLTDEQKAQFEAIGPARGNAAEANAAVNDDAERPTGSTSRRHRHGHGVHNVERAIRRLISIIP